jgi:1,4-dihydroxy-6-naphthoate synthase
MYQHINLYVNKYSINLGFDGRKAIELLFKRAIALGLVDEAIEDIFL